MQINDTIQSAFATNIIAQNSTEPKEAEQEQANNKTKTQRLTRVKSKIPNKIKNKLLLNRKEAAELLDCKASTLATWLSTKRYPLAYVKIGKNIRYKRSDVLEFIENNLCKSNSIIETK